MKPIIKKDNNINNSVVESYPNFDAMLFDLLGTGTDDVTTTMINSNNSKSNSNFNTTTGIAKKDNININNNINNNSGIVVESYPNLDTMLFDLLGDTDNVTMINTGMMMMKKEDTGKQEQEQVVVVKSSSSSSSSVAVVTAAELDSYLTTSTSTTTMATATTFNSSSSASSSSNGSRSSQQLPLLVEFQLHPKLQKNMSNGLVQRVSFYSIIHDINKETTTAGADIVTYSSNIASYNNNKTALIDAEQWLLDVIAIDSSSSSRNLNFEKKTTTATTTTTYRRKTRLWKPQYSWWNAKSGYNANLEPKYHDKRWGYLWNLIHYHKFIKKCIKKLKKNHYRNDSDDGGSGCGIICLNNDNNSSAFNFLYEEVQAVSDHLAIVSLYDSDTWMDCLDHFDGWTNESSEQVLKHTRQIIRNLKLTTSLGDIDFGIDIDTDSGSALLVRSQIDEQYLSALIRVKTAKSPSLVKGTADGVKTTAEEDNDYQSYKSKSSSSSWSSSTISSVGGVGLSDESSRLRPAPKGRTTSSLRRREDRLQKTFKYSLPVINPSSSSSSSSSFVATEVVSRPSIPHRPRRRKAKQEQKHSNNAEIQSVATSSSAAHLIAGHSSQVQNVGYNNYDQHYHYPHHHHDQQQEWHEGGWWWSESNGWQYHYFHHHPHHHYNPCYYGDSNTDDGTNHFSISACDTAPTTTFNTGFYSQHDETY